ncbi:uncharacterized protein [Drosophila kikkawai]|uniref:Uncharacterized protein n=1 Tax=Drosophila kikkawai TaxID=30033 RepID=A0ABM3C5T2_DROKI|nr:uncharacterized protein LOC108075145 [Drosophila kikkawai]
MAFNLYSLDVKQQLVQELMALLQEVQEFDFSKFWETGTGDIKCQLTDKLFPNIRQNLDKIEAIINHENMLNYVSQVTSICNKFQNMGARRETIKRIWDALDEIADELSPPMAKRRKLEEQ